MNKETRDKVLRSDPVGLIAGFAVVGIVGGVLHAMGAPEEAGFLAMGLGCVTWMAIARRFPGQRKSK